MCVQAGQTYICVKHDYVTARCQEEWGRTDDMCFFVELDTKNWTEAKDYCASTGGELLTFVSQEQYQHHKGWLFFRVDLLTRNTTTSGKIWTGQAYTLNMPRWMPIETTATNDSNLCLGLPYNRTGFENSTVHIGPMEAVSCDENNGFACQQKAPGYWP
ncbi:perlucin-like protein [Pecten maximus]|uniref:perlucin-like protein n=1 Tax=Pecten maximus TaxID=6579 RepID=UPI001458EF1E|nr:perlucin-like protein [Pecten maximus]